MTFCVFHTWDVGWLFDSAILQVSSRLEGGLEQKAGQLVQNYGERYIAESGLPAEDPLRNNQVGEAWRSQRNTNWACICTVCCIQRLDFTWHVSAHRSRSNHFSPFGVLQGLLSHGGCDWYFWGLLVIPKWETKTRKNVTSFCRLFPRNKIGRELSITISLCKSSCKDCKNICMLWLMNIESPWLQFWCLCLLHHPTAGGNEDRSIAKSPAEADSQVAGSFLFEIGYPCKFDGNLNAFAEYHYCSLLLSKKVTKTSLFPKYP